jgi:hypothetical protein
MMLDDEKLCKELLSLQANRNLLLGGRPASKTVVTLAALACAGLPMVVLLPLGIGLFPEPPHLAFVSLSPLVLDQPLALSAILAAVFVRRWAAPAHRRYCVVVATVAAAVLRIAIYTGAVIGDLTHAPQLGWILSHLVDTAVISAAIIVVAVLGGGSAQPPWISKSRSSPLNIQDPQCHDRFLSVKAGHYMRLPYFRRRALRRDAEHAA